MGTAPGDRSAQFPAIERKYGKPMSHWFAVMKKLRDEKYADQMAHLVVEYGFSRAHANALVMYSRGSRSTRRFDSFDAYLSSLDSVAASTVRKIFTAIRAKHKDLELVIAWNQPMLRRGKDYVFGVSVASKHILLAPWGTDAIARLGHVLDGYVANKKTVQVPLDWKVDPKLLLAMVDQRLSELGSDPRRRLS